MRIGFGACTSLFLGVAVSLPAQVANPAAPGWVASSALYEVFVRDFSPEGTLAGVTRGLDRIQATGADVVWLMPIFPLGALHRKDPLGSPYSVRDYRAVNPDFGTLADFKALVAAAHARKMRVVLDWVPNHTSWDHEWTRTHRDFHVRDEKGNLTVPRDDKGKLTDWTDVAQLDYRNPAMRKAMIDALRFWLVEQGVDGFRFDVAGFVPAVFWREAIPALRASVPRELLMLAEWGDLEMHRMGFDLTYAWDSYRRLKEAWKGGPASVVVTEEIADLAKMPAGGRRLRFSTNHDETAWDAPPVKLFGGSAGARAAFVAMALLPGRPLLYNGQEVESPQTLGLFVKEPIAWNLPGAAETRAFYRKVIDLARTDPALLTGDFRSVATTASRDVIGYTRGDVLVLVNIRNRPIQVGITGFRIEGARDLLSGRIVRAGMTSLPAFGVLVAARR